MYGGAVLRARLLIVSAAVLWSTAGAAIKLSALDGWQLAGGRSLVAAAVLFLAMKETRKAPDRKVWAVAAAYAATVVLFVSANRLTTAANAIFIQDSAPLFVLALSWAFLRERPSAQELLAVPVFLLGLGLFFLDHLSLGQLRGNLVALASGVAFALCITGMRALKDRAAAAAAHGNLVAVAVCLPFAAFGPTPRPLDLGLVAFLGVFQLGLAYALFARGIRDTPAVEASLLVLLEPVLNPIWALLFAGERPGPLAVAGGAIILGATAWRAWASWRASRLGRYQSMGLGPAKGL